MTSNMQMQNAINQIVNGLVQILQNPQAFMQQFLNAMNNPASGQQMNIGQLNVPTAPAPAQPAAPATNPLTNLGAGTDAASMSIQYSNMEAARDASAGQN